MSIDTLVGRNPKGCLNLKSEWGLSKNPSLETRARSARQPKIPPNKRSKVGEEANGDREERETAPQPKRKRDRSPRTLETVESNGPAALTTGKTGANTPVRVKIRRLQSKIDGEGTQKRVATKIQPTLSHF